MEANEKLLSSLGKLPRIEAKAKNIIAENFEDFYQLNFKPRHMIMTNDGVSCYVCISHITDKAHISLTLAITKAMQMTFNMHESCYDNLVYTPIRRKKNENNWN